MTELKITWKKFSEEFPKHGEDILISNDNGTIVAAATYIKHFQEKFYFEPLGCGGYDFEWDFDFRIITQWAHFPKPIPKNIQL